MPLPYLVLGDDFCVIIQHVAKHVTTHALPGLVVKVLKEGVEMFQLQDGQNVVVGINGDLQKPGQLLRNSAACCNAKGTSRRDRKR